MGLKTKTYVGVADAHGIESFHDKNDTTYFDRKCRFIRADANRHRHAVYFEAELDSAGFKLVNTCLNDQDFELALDLLKTFSQEIQSPAQHQSSWELIPNSKLDPYK